MESNSKEVCINCKYVVHLIALGLGMRCNHPKRNSFKETFTTLIPSRDYTCELFKHK